MEIQFNPLLVTFSILVAIFASYVALNLAHTVTQAKGKAQLLWLACGSLAMGSGIWSMHFVGMLAFEMPGMAMAYDVPLMILSVVVAVGASTLALYIISRSIVQLGSIISGGIAMAAAIAGMHYIGMFSMRMEAVIKWNIFLVVLSILIALIASFGALFILSRLRNKTDQLMQLLLASTVMGFAISGMHYTGMYAATFIHDHSVQIHSSNLIVSSGLSIIVITTTLLILGLALASSVGQRLWSLRNQRAKEILGKSEERFRHLVEAVKDYAIFMLDPNGFITTWNSGAERITGYTEKEAIGRHVSLFHTDESIQNSVVEKELKMTSEAGHYETETQQVRKDGSVYWASTVISPLYDQNKVLTGYSKVIRDITNVRETESRMRLLNEELENRVKDRTHDLAKRETQLRTITDAAPVLMAELDVHEKILFANEAFCRWFHLKDRNVIGMSFLEILGEDRYSVSKPFIDEALAGKTVTYERESQSGNVTAILGVTFVPEFDNTNHCTGFVVVASDITKHKEIQKELEKAKEAAEVANATKSAFLANMSHEIRTPLGAILGFSEILLGENVSESEKANSFEIIKRNGRLLSNIINDILDLSKVEAGKLEVEKMDVPFEDVMNEISSVLNLEASEKGIELTVASEGIIPRHIKTDPLRLRQILFNIVGNAIKFTKRGSVNVVVKLLHMSDGPTKLAFIVKDTGEGIKKEQVDRLFTPFSQADVSTTRKFGGTGLGLVLSKKLAKALGGDIVLTETTPGKGSTFVITIEPGPAEQILFQSKPAPLQNLMRLTDKRAHADLKFMKILVVDDSPDNQALIKKILSLAGATIETAHNGREAVDKALAGNFDLVLMDLQMPEMDGYEATKILREKGYQKPIIALTAHAMKEERQRSLQSGFDDHLTKPIDHQALVKTLADYTA
ncbi:MAG: MHYT domain-containing protein [Pseudobdellovibrionaceae bacterium]